MTAREFFKKALAALEKFFCETSEHARATKERKNRYGIA